MLFYVNFDYLHNAVPIYLILNLSYHIVGSIKDFHLTIKEIIEVDESCNENEIKTLRLRKLNDCVSQHLAIIRYKV